MRAIDAVHRISAANVAVRSPVAPGSRARQQYVQYRAGGRLARLRLEASVIRFVVYHGGSDRTWGISARRIKKAPLSQGRARGHRTSTLCIYIAEFDDLMQVPTRFLLRSADLLLTLGLDHVREVHPEEPRRSHSAHHPVRDPRVDSPLRPTRSSRRLVDAHPVAAHAPPSRSSPPPTRTRHPPTRTRTGSRRGSGRLPTVGAGR